MGKDHLGKSWAFGPAPRPLRRENKIYVPLIAAMTVFFTVAMLGIAWADQVEGDIVGPEALSVSIAAGGSVNESVDLYVKRQGGQPVTGVDWNAPTKVGTCSSITAGSAAPSSLTMPSNWSTQPNGTLSSTLGVKSTATITGTAGAAGQQCVVTYTGTGVGNAFPGGQNSVAVTLSFVAPSDTTPPVITPSIVGTLGNNGWYVSDVTVSWTVADPESGIASSTGCGSTTINADTAGTTLTCSATNGAGLSNSASVTVKRDATAPTASASASPGPNANGWNNTDVTVSFSGADGLSGIDFCDSAVVLSSEAAGQSASGTCTDMAGNVSAPATASGINIDKTAPSVSLVGGPADGGSYYFGFVPAAPTCGASDALSGLDGTCSVSGYSTAVGSHTVSASATDLAGNVASTSASYTVLAWALYGFYQPVDMNGVYNTVKGGSTVPLKFEIFAGSTELTDTAYVASLATTQVTCTAGAHVDAIETTATGGTVLRYDMTGGQFIYNWQTPKKPGNCYRVTMTTLDGSSLSALFKLK